MYLWEFGQNDSKRDSGSKMVRLGYANQLRVGQSFPGVVLSSEAKVIVLVAFYYILLLPYVTNVHYLIT